MARVFNFNPGPAALPLAALERAQNEFTDFKGTGMSILEHSHRGKVYDAVHNEAIGLIRELLDVPEDYHVLFLQGGASQQFAVVPMNLLPAGKSADYILTGAWGKKAFGGAGGWDRAACWLHGRREVHARDQAARAFPRPRCCLCAFHLERDDSRRAVSRCFPGDWKCAARLRHVQ